MSNILSLTTTTTMTSREIASLVGSPHDSVLKTVRRLIEEGVVSGNDTPYTHPQNGQKYSEFVLDFRNTMVVASGYSTELRARIIDRWQELEAKEPVEQNLPPSLPSPAEDAVRVGTLLAIALNLHGTEKASMISRALQLKAPEYVSLMPAYATNAPRTTDGKLLGGEGNSRPAYAASALLKKLGSDMTIHAFNRLAEDAGYLEVVERPSTKHQGVQRTFKAVSAKGLEFGYNLSNASSKGSTQPVWFQHSFSNLLNLILG